ncbi:hypothetical protein BJI67_05660 [Acidihalobacter aeolianus]|uniref:Uncharacterized protein n=1 Tax=Acidihalobacter aeolianus TaxID=2792603 RepID=A0A1D8K6L7_9GAMM|nr:hypothetical protein [Acidihalobacter aeolianus]AOV16622.1 hypothetical protein BJI67_05660 [Acidihalobacter aeolianus]
MLDNVEGADERQRSRSDVAKTIHQVAFLDGQTCVARTLDRHPIAVDTGYRDARILQQGHPLATSRAQIQRGRLQRLMDFLRNRQIIFKTLPDTVEAPPETLLEGAVEGLQPILVCPCHWF